jgi:hypothetical protein
VKAAALALGMTGARHRSPAAPPGRQIEIGLGAAAAAESWKTIGLLLGWGGGDVV